MNPIYRKTIYAILTKYQSKLDELVRYYSKQAIKEIPKKITILESDPSLFLTSGLLVGVKGYKSSLALPKDNSRTDHIHKLGNMTQILDFFLNNQLMTPVSLSFSLMSLSYDAFLTHSKIRSKQKYDSFKKTAGYFATPHSSSKFVSTLTECVAKLQKALEEDFLWRSSIHAKKFEVYQNPEEHEFVKKQLAQFKTKLVERLDTISSLKADSGIHKASKLIGLSKTKQKNAVCQSAKRKIEYYWGVLERNKLSREEFLSGTMATLMEAYYENAMLNPYNLEGNHEAALKEHMVICNMMIGKLLEESFSFLRKAVGEKQEAEDLSYLDEDVFTEVEKEDIGAYYSAPRAKPAPSKAKPKSKSKSEKALLSKPLVSSEEVFVAQALSGDEAADSDSEEAMRYAIKSAADSDSDTGEEAAQVSKPAVKKQQAEHKGAGKKKTVTKPAVSPSGDLNFFAGMTFDAPSEADSDEEMPAKVKKKAKSKQKQKPVHDAASDNLFDSFGL